MRWGWARSLNVALRRDKRSRETPQGLSTAPAWALRVALGNSVKAEITPICSVGRRRRQQRRHSASLDALLRVLAVDAGFGVRARMGVAAFGP